MNHSLTCTFCRKSEHDVRKLVAGPGVYICDACIETAYRIITQSLPPRRAPLWRRAVGRLGRTLTGIATKPSYTHRVRMPSGSTGSTSPARPAVSRPV